MMSFSCPHCGTEKAGFKLHGEQMLFGAEPNLRWACYACGVCGKPAIRVYHVTKNFAPDVDVERQNGVSVVKIWPQLPPAEAPAATPDQPARFFAQAMRSLQRGDFDAAGAMARKSMEAALKIIDAESKAKTIYERIEGLAPEKGITPAMKEWAHELRALGADAAHELDPFSEPEARSTVEFARVLFEYLFTMPAQVTESRTARIK